MASPTPRRLSLFKSLTLLQSLLICAMRTACAQECFVRETFALDETQVNATYRLSTPTFDDNSSANSFFGQFVVPSIASSAFTGPWTDGFALFASHLNASTANDISQTVTLNDINVKGVALLYVTLSVGAASTAFASPDGVQVFATVDNLNRTLLGQWVPTSASGGSSLSLDEDFDGVGDGTSVLDSNLEDFYFDIANTGDLLTLEIVFNSTSPGRVLVLDQVEVCGDQPLPPPNFFLRDSNDTTDADADVDDGESSLCPCFGASENPPPVE